MKRVAHVTTAFAMTVLSSMALAEEVPAFFQTPCENIPGTYCVDSEIESGVVSLRFVAFVDEYEADSVDDIAETYFNFANWSDYDDDRRITIEVSDADKPYEPGVYDYVHTSRYKVRVSFGGLQHKFGVEAVTRYQKLSIPGADLAVQFEVDRGATGLKYQTGRIGVRELQEGGVQVVLETTVEPSFAVAAGITKNAIVDANNAMLEGMFNVTPQQ